MRLMPDRNPCHSELEMQNHVAEYFSKRIFRGSGMYGPPIVPKIYKEITISQIGRISDIIIYLTDRKIINIECKLTDYGTVLSQAINHLSWADYSYICLYADTYLPAYAIDKMLTNGIGLLLWTPELFLEVIQSGYNKHKDKTIREEVLKKLKRKDQVQTGKIELVNQMTIF